jgi:hypothetical protein
LIFVLLEKQADSAELGHIEAHFAGEQVLAEHLAQ